MPEQEKILFLSHDASRSGAPLVLLEFLRFFREKSHLLPEIVLKRGGPLAPEFEALAPVHYCRRRETRFMKRLSSGVRCLVGYEIPFHRLSHRFPQEKYPIVYANTIATLDVAQELCRRGRRCIVHVHELNYAAGVIEAAALLQRSQPYVSAYIAVSEHVRDYLVHKVGLRADKVTVVHGFPIRFHRTDEALGLARARARRLLEVDDETFVVGMCGSLDWRKGADLFVQLALHLKQKMRRRFVCAWVGAGPHGLLEVEHDIAAAGLAGNVQIIPACEAPEDYLAAFDVFALTSREDPFSVAMLEAAASGVPVVAFSGSGGAAELIEEDAGILAPYLDVPALAAAIAKLAEASDMRANFGACIRRKARTRYDRDAQCARLLQVIAPGVEAETLPLEMAGA